jgi:hypothetical protein
MAKAELKTKQTDAGVYEFIATVGDEQQRADSRAVVDLMRRISKEEPKMWGTAIVGFGRTTLKYDSGRELDWMKIGFSPRKGNLTLYGLLKGNEKQLDKLGKFKIGKGCLYLKRLTDVDTKALEKMIVLAFKNKS